MTNSIAIVLLLLLAGFFALDSLWLHQDYALQLARAFVQLIEWLSFWR